MTYIPGSGAGGAGKVSSSQDVALNNPSENHALMYNSAIAKWVNRPVDTETVSGLGAKLAALDQRLDALEGNSADPNPVSDVTATVSATAVTLGWANPEATNIDQIVIRRVTGNQPPLTHTAGTGVAALGPTATSYADSNLSANTQYSYSIFVVDVAGNVSTGISVTATTPANTSTGGLRINVGGNGGTYNAVAWTADSYVGGNIYVVPDSQRVAMDSAIGGTSPLFYTHRYGSGGKLPINVTTGYSRCLVRLHMIEPTFANAGSRVFTWNSSRGQLTQPIDLAATQGLRQNPLVVEIVEDATNGTLVLESVATIDNPILGAVEVLDGAGMTLTAPVTSGGTSPAPEPNPNPNPGTVYTDGAGYPQAAPSDRVRRMTYVNTHWSYSDYKVNPDGVVDRLLELGVAGIRDHTHPNERTRNRIAGQAGLKLDLIPHSPFDSTRYREMADTHVALAPYVDCILGVNEPRTSASDTRQKIIDVWNAVRARSELNGFPVVSHGATGPTQPHSSGFNDVAPYIDAFDWHLYPAGTLPWKAGSEDHFFNKPYAAMRNIASAKQVLTDNRTWDFLYESKKQGKVCVVSSEMGWHNKITGNDSHRGAPEDVTALYAPAVLLWHDYQKNFARVHFYEMMNQQISKGSDKEGQFGLVRGDLTPKPIFNSLKNFLGLYADKGNAFVPGTLDYTVSNKNARTFTTLHQKRSGIFLLGIISGEIVWDDSSYTRLNPADDHVTIQFNKRNVRVRVYEPHKSSVPSAWTSVAKGSPYSIAAHAGAKIMEIEIQP